MTKTLSVIHSHIQKLPTKARHDFNFWRDRIEPLLNRDDERGIGEALKLISTTTGVPFRTVQRKFHNARKHGLLALIDRRLCGPRFWKTRAQLKITAADESLVKLYCENNQRSTRQAVKRLRLDWRRGIVKTETPIDRNTGFPRGWSIDNLMRYAPSKFELKSVRIGRTAAASERPLVYTTRRGLYVGSHYMFDDLWHDLEVISLGERQHGRPLEIFSHDLFSARKIRWGIRVRTQRPDGSHNQLTERMMRQIVAATLHLDGYHAERGTTIIAEHGTAAVRDRIEAALYDMSDGKIVVARSGMTGAKTHAGQYDGISRGNPRFKASLESSNNLVHNVFASLPGQTGLDRNQMPEETPARVKNALQLLGAANDRIQLPVLTDQQFIHIATELYREIENDPDHDLEGWEQCGHVATELLLGGNWIDQRALLADAAQSELALLLIRAGTLQTRARKMTRGEVWRAGAGALRRIPGSGVCAILGDDLATTRRVMRNMFEFEDREVGPGAHRFDAIAFNEFGEALRLADREKYETFVNPFAPDRLFVRRADGSYIGECKRIETPCRGDVEAVQRRCGEVAAIEAELLAPVRERHIGEAVAKQRRHEHNIKVLTNRPVTPVEVIRDAQNRARIRKETGSLDDLSGECAPVPTESHASEGAAAAHSLSPEETAEIVIDDLGRESDDGAELSLDALIDNNQPQNESDDNNGENSI